MVFPVAFAHFNPGAIFRIRFRMGESIVQYAKLYLVLIKLELSIIQFQNIINSL